jgi:hypothetical protein
MCFDKESSLLAWTISYTIAWYLYERNLNVDRWNAGFIIAFSTIQLLEGGLWSFQKGGHSNEINDLLTRLILLTLVCQPFFQTTLGYKYTKSKFLGMLSFILLGIIIWTCIRLWKSTPGQFSSHPGPGGHLIWNDDKSGWFLGGPLIGAIYFAGMFIPLLFMLQKYDKALLLLVIGIITVIYSLFYAPGREFGSFWCFSAVAYSIAALFV